MKSLKTFDDAKKVNEAVAALAENDIKADISNDGSEFIIMISVHNFIRARDVVLALDKEKVVGS
jgi:hypothetical protein